MTLTDPDPAPLGYRLRAARIAAGLTQADVASRMPGHVTVQYISDVERGRRLPSLEWLWEVAGALGVNPHTLDERLMTTKGRASKAGKRSPKRRLD